MEYLTNDEKYNLFFINLIYFAIHSVAIIKLQIQKASKNKRCKSYSTKGVKLEKILKSVEKTGKDHSELCNAYALLAEDPQPARCGGKKRLEGQQQTWRAFVLRERRPSCSPGHPIAW